MKTLSDLSANSFNLEIVSNNGKSNILNNKSQIDAFDLKHIDHVRSIRNVSYRTINMKINIHSNEVSGKHESLLEKTTNSSCVDSMNIFSKMAKKDSYKFKCLMALHPEIFTDNRLPLKQIYDNIFNY